MDYIKEAEKYLENYKRLERANINLDSEIENLNMRRTADSFTQNYDITGVRGGRKQMDAYDQIYQWTQLQAMKTANTEAINNIEYNLKFISLESGCERYGDLLRMWYIEKLSKEELASELCCSIPQIYRNKADAIKMFAVQLFGIKAVV